MELIDGKAISEIIKKEITEIVIKRKSMGYKIPHLAAIIVGNDGASKTYIINKVKTCEKVGFNSTIVELSENITEENLLKEIYKLNSNKDIDGFIVQLPLPKHIDEHKIILAISPEKDVDGFHPVNVGKMTLGLPTLLSATPYGIIELLERYKIETTGKDIVVIGRSNIVGRPISILLSQKGEVGDATVTLAHSRTKNLSEITKKADIIIAALGKPEFLTGEMVKEGVIIIDVGITRIEDKSKKQGYRLAGDAHFESVSQKAAFITPVPGGVGPMTIAMLLKNTLKASMQQS